MSRANPLVGGQTPSVASPHPQLSPNSKASSSSLILRFDKNPVAYQTTTTMKMVVTYRGAIRPKDSHKTIDETVSFLGTQDNKNQVEIKNKDLTSLYLFDDRGLSEAPTQTINGSLDLNIDPWSLEGMGGPGSDVFSAILPPPGKNYPRATWEDSPSSTDGLTTTTYRSTYLRKEKFQNLECAVVESKISTRWDIGSSTGKITSQTDTSITSWIEIKTGYLLKSRNNTTENMALIGKEGPGSWKGTSSTQRVRK